MWITNLESSVGLVVDGGKRQREQATPWHGAKQCTSNPASRADRETVTDAGLSLSSQLRCLSPYVPRDHQTRLLCTRVRSPLGLSPGPSK